MATSDIHGALQESSVDDAVQDVQPATDTRRLSDVEDLKKPTFVVESAAGVARSEGMQLVFGKHGKKILWSGLILMLLA